MAHDTAVFKSRSLSGRIVSLRYIAPRSQSRDQSNFLTSGVEHASDGYRYSAGSKCFFIRDRDGCSTGNSKDIAKRGSFHISQQSSNGTTDSGTHSNRDPNPQGPDYNTDHDPRRDSPAYEDTYGESEPDENADGYTYVYSSANLPAMRSTKHPMSSRRNVWNVCLQQSEPDL